MKFVCHNCKAKYTISDEKVRNKRLKIRCKKCAAIIELVDPAAVGRVSVSPGRSSAAPSVEPKAQVSKLQGIFAEIDAECAPKPDSSPTVCTPNAPRLNLFQPGVTVGADPLRGAAAGVLDAPVSAAPSVEKDISEAEASTPAAGGRKSRRLYLVVSAAFFVTSLATLGAVLLGGDSKEQPPEVRIEERVVEKVVYRDRLVTADRAEASAGSPEDEHRASASSRGARSRKSAAKKRAEEERAQALLARMSASVPESSRSIGPSGKSAASGGIRDGSDGLSADQMKRVVNSNKAAMKQCYERSLKKGEAPSSKDVRVDFKVTVGASGTVTRVSLSGEGAGHSLLKSCLRQSVKRWVFPASNRESSLEFPFVFTPTG